MKDTAILVLKLTAWALTCGWLFTVIFPPEDEAVEAPTPNVPDVPDVPVKKGKIK